MSEGPREQDNNRSSLFEKLPPDLRRQLDLAIVHRAPPTFKDVWMQFELARFGVSYSAFYRYARRLRDRINTAEAVLLSGDDEPDVDAAIQKLLSQRLLELLLHTGGAECTQEIAALTAAHRRGAKNAHDHHRLELDRDHLRLKTQALEWARKARTRPAESTPLRLACSNDAQPSAESDRGPRKRGQRGGHRGSSRAG